MNRRVLAELSEAMLSEVPVVLATVIDTRRSVPRHAGSKMLVYADGRTSGSIGGGEMEARVVAEAAAALTDGRPRRLSYELVDPGGGDPGVCGGEVDLYLEAYMPAPTVFVVGCGHIGRAVVDLADWLGFRVVAYDDREDLASADELPKASAVHSGDLAAALDTSPITSETHVVVVTRNMEVDVRALPILIASPARTIGVMGSQRRWLQTRQALEERGVAAEELDRLIAPIGLELKAETPEEIALSILSQIILERRGGTGDSMADGDG